MSEVDVNTEWQGLSSQDAAKALKKHGLNQIREEKMRSAWSLLAEQFKSPLVLILIFACGISLFLGEQVEAIAIGAILIINALIGFFQEYRAESAIKALQEMTSPRAHVVRDGVKVLILAHDVVPGDLLYLEAGDIVAADGDILELARLQINEAVLTGESLPVRKELALDIDEHMTKVFMGTSVATGTALVRVRKTGMATELGKIAHLLSTAQSDPTPLQVQLAKVGRSLLWVCLGVVFVVAVIGIFQGRSLLDLLIFSLSLAVAAVPEGMPAIVTVALALGVQRLAGRNALIRKLPSVETLGSVSVICTDKTGTLTTGDMRVREVWGEDHTEVLRAAASCCDADLLPEEMAGTGDPTELAILIAARERGIEKSRIEHENPRVRTEPFDSELRRMSVIREDGSVYIKGAVESVLSLLKSEFSGSASMPKALEDMSSRGLRVLAVARGEDREDGDLRFLGLLGLADPPRPEVLPAIKEARSAGIMPIMITGDHPVTAKAIARELCLASDGESLEDKVYARATPEDKLNLVRSLKKKGEIVAMTGDGVNDAPALREAHIGIAMGKAGTEVTRQAADLILADDNFATIVEAVREGRHIFQNIRKALTYLLIGNFAEILVVLGSIALGLPLPLLATHLLWINLVTDALPALTLIAEPPSPNLMKRGPRLSSEAILARAEWSQIIGIGFLEALVAMALYWHFLSVEGEVVARNLLFSTLVMSQLFRSFASRSSTRVLGEVGLFTNLWLLSVVLLTFSLQLALHYMPFTQELFMLRPLSLTDVCILIPVASISTAVIELRKIWLKRLRVRL